MPIHGLLKAQNAPKHLVGRGSARTPLEELATFPRPPRQLGASLPIPISSTPSASRSRRIPRLASDLPLPLISHCYTKLYELDSVVSVWTETYELVDWTTRRGRHSVVVRALLVPVPALYFLVLLHCTHTSHQSQLNRYLHKPGSRQVAILALKT